MQSAEKDATAVEPAFMDHQQWTVGLVENLTKQIEAAVQEKDQATPGLVAII